METLRKSSSMIMVFMGLLVFLIVPTWAQEDVKDEITNQTIMIDRAVTTLDNFLVDKKWHGSESTSTIPMGSLLFLS